MDRTQVIKHQIELHNINLKQFNTQFRATENQEKDASRSHNNYIIGTKHEIGKKKKWSIN